MELGCRDLMDGLTRNLSHLSAIATLAPITGFLGTGTGMIVAFRDITQSTDVSPQMVADGIYQALITTAAGLIITVIASLFYFLYSAIVKRYAVDMERTVNAVYRNMEEGDTSHET